MPKARFATPDDLRCRSCGITTTENTPDALLKRGERLLFFAETVANRANDNEDYRLLLASLDRAKNALELLMKGVGLLRPDTVVVDNRQVNIYQNWSTPNLEALQTFHDVLASGATVTDAIDAVQTTPSLALPAPVERADVAEYSKTHA